MRKVFRFFGLALIAMTIVLSATSCSGNKTDLSHLRTGSYITDIYTDKSMYNPLETVKIITEFKNPSDSEFKGEYIVRITKQGEKIDEIKKQITLKADATEEIVTEYKAPASDYTGYAVEAYLNKDNTTVDYEMSAIDVSSSWEMFPRYAYLSTFYKSETEKNRQTIEDLSKYHINGLFYFDVIDRHDRPLAGTINNPDKDWKNLAMHNVSAQTVNEYIQFGHENNMSSFVYNLIFGAYPDYEKLGIKTEWGMFKDKLHKEFDEHPLPANWKAVAINLFDPGNKGWQDYFIKVHKDFLSKYSFDGIQADSLGQREYPIYNYNGEEIKLDNRYVDFLNRINRELNTKVIFNAVGAYGHSATLSKSSLDVIFTEAWPWTHPSYSSLKEHIDSTYFVTEGKRGIVMPAYMNYEKGKGSGFFNTAGINYTNAAILAAGGMHFEIGNRGMLCREYYITDNLKMDNELKKDLRNYYTFMTAYENLLRGEGLKEEVRRTLINDSATSRNGKAGKVWVYVKTKEAECTDILQLINFTQIKDTAWVDAYGKQPKANEMKDSRIRHYIDRNVKNVYAASPDYKEGIAEKISFETGSDSKGKYIEFTLPYLEYWTMVIIK